MKLSELYKTLRFCAIGTLIFSISAFINCAGSELTIPNQSFENPPLPDGQLTLSVPGWSGQGTATIYNPDNSFFVNTSDGAAGSPIDGTNAAALNAGGKLLPKH